MVVTDKKEPGEIESCPECGQQSVLIVESWGRGTEVQHTDLFRICEEETKTGRANRYHFHFNKRP